MHLPLLRFLSCGICPIGIRIQQRRHLIELHAHRLANRAVHDIQCPFSMRIFDRDCDTRTPRNIEFLQIPQERNFCVTLPDDQDRASDRARVLFVPHSCGTAP